MASVAPSLTPQEAIIYLMLTASASDGAINPSELRTIGRVVRSFPLFSSEDEERLPGLSNDARTLMASEGGLHKVMDAAKQALPEHLAETAYAAVVDVVTADETLHLEEIRMLELIRDALNVSDDGAAAIEHAARARHMTLEEPV
ncbi:MAG: tellurite resistance TerB family protein [Parvularcula sp.]|nr:tellurite resistance TerB family protein [Parvularcula sp.]